MFEIAAPTPRARRVAILIAVAAGFVALAIRWYYVMHAQVLQPIDQPNVRADAVDYYRYAWNLVHHATFANDLPGSETIHPNSFREPGYPLMLAAWMAVTSAFGAWYGAVLLTQALIGALTVSLLLLTVRGLIPNALLAVAAVLLCVWPHSVAMTSYILTETLLGFLCAAALLAIRAAANRPSVSRLVMAGSIIGLAALTNAVIVPFGVLAALVLYAARHITRQQAAILVASALLLPAAWGIRGMMIPPTLGASGRATMNLVQGSWPNYHADYGLSAKGDVAAAARMRLIDDDIATLQRSTSQGLHRMVARLVDHPIEYLAWYASKPALLWGWDIRIGQGDVYVYPTAHSPFKELPAWKAIWAACFLLNPILLLLAILGAIYSFVRPRQRTGADLALGTLFLMVTAIYGALQSEPRYSVPYKGIEVILAMMAVRRSWRWYRQRIGSRDAHHTSASAQRKAPALV